MLIRSQDKHSLINLENIQRLTAGKVYGKDETDWIIELDRQPFTENLGRYFSEAKAIKALDMIQGLYDISSVTHGIITFQMPSDEEVEA